MIISTDYTTYTDIPLEPPNDEVICISVEDLKDLLDIASPSKAMMEVSNIVKEHFMLGIDNATYINEIQKVIFHDPATIVFWKDGTKTVVKCKNEPFDPEKGLAMCIAKKTFGNKGNYFNTFKKWLPK